MRSIDFIATVSAAPATDKVVQDRHTLPTINQTQNAAIAQHELIRRMEMPVEPERADGKKIKDRQQRHDKNPRDKRRFAHPATSTTHPTSTESGFFVDVDA